MHKSLDANHLSAHNPLFVNISEALHMANELYLDYYENNNCKHVELLRCT